MKLTAFSAGRPGGNSEIYLKEALMAAEAKGVEVELIRLTDCDLHNCRDCSPNFCLAQTDVTKCPYGKDDCAWLVEKFLDSDGYIIDKKTASIGNLQRAFRIGFNRAARIMDQLAEAGVVGEAQGTKSREILMTPEQFEELVRQG